MIKSLWSEFIALNNKKPLPVVTPSIILAMTTGIVSSNARSSTRSLFASPLSFLTQSLFERPSVPVIAKTKKTKPVLLFDINNFLCCNRFSLKRFDMVTLKRAYSDIFLYSNAHYYEMILVSDMPQFEGSKILDKLDPYGFISYRIFLNNKKEFNKNHLNRDINRLAVISTSINEFHSDFNNNLISIKEWTGDYDSKLFDLIHFFTTLHYMDLKDFRKTIKSYQGHDFFATFRKAQKRLFNQRNLFSSKHFDEKLAEVNEKKMKDYKESEKSFKRIKPNKDAMQDVIVRFIKGLFL